MTWRGLGHGFHFVIMRSSSSPGRAPVSADSSQDLAQNVSYSLEEELRVPGFAE